VLVATGAPWTTRLITVGAGDYTYFVEFGCPQALADRCRSGLESVLGGLTFNPA
jgi:hypothetical protein